MTLTMIETPSTEATVVLVDSDEPDAPLDMPEKESLLTPTTEQDVEITLIPAKPITSRLRSTIRHLTAVGGFRARWRGLPVGLLYCGLVSMAIGVFDGPFTYIFPHPLHRPLLHTVVILLFIRTHIAWTHATIAQPPFKHFRFRDLTRRHCWRQLALPTALLCLGYPLLHRALHFVLQNVEAVAVAWGNMTILYIAMAVAFILALAVDVHFALPLAATIARIETSMLPTSEETLVPCDRTFGARILSADAASTQTAFAVFGAAWKTVDRTLKIRLVKLYLKMVAIFLALGVVLVHALMLELWVMMGDDLPVLMLAFMGKMQRQQGPAL